MAGSNATWADRQLATGRGRNALTREFVEDLQRTTTHCTCCGIALAFEGFTKGRKPVQHYATMDRVRADLGYVSWNVQVICFRCNTLKTDMDAAKIRQLLAYVEKYQPVLR